MYRVWTLLVIILLVTACATSPTGRRQLQLFPNDQMAAMGAAAFANVREQMPESSNSRADRYVSCVADAITNVVEGPYAGTDWEVVVFDEPSANAFALPGGKIGVHTGLLDVARNQHQLATVLAHEVGHVMAEHSNERVSTAYATQAGLQVVDTLAGGSPEQRNALMGLLGLGAQVGIILPFSRVQETESDVIGLELMAKAGFDPRESVELWRNMSAAAEGQPPEFLSTHPSHGTRIEDLQARMPEAIKLYEQARAAGRKPNCG